MTVSVMDDPDVTAAEQKVNKWSLSSQSVFEKSNCRNRLLQPALAALQHARVVSGGQERTQMDTQPSVHAHGVQAAPICRIRRRP